MFINYFIPFVDSFIVMGHILKSQSRAEPWLCLWRICPGKGFSPSLKTGLRARSGFSPLNLSIQKNTICRKTTSRLLHCAIITIRKGAKIKSSSSLGPQITHYAFFCSIRMLFIIFLPYLNVLWKLTLLPSQHSHFWGICKISKKGKNCQFS